MSRFCKKSINTINPYVPGEQLNDKKYIKLNTNENPFYPSDTAVKSISQERLEKLNRYSDPESSALCQAIAKYYNISENNVMATNGSDEALAFAFMAYGKKICFPDVTYGFYGVLANLFNCKSKTIPLNDDFTISPQTYYNIGKTIVIANPNAQTGIALPQGEIENIVKNNPQNVVIIDQAYVDFSDGNAIELIGKYENLLVINTFSKSRSLAGARVGFAVACEKIIQDLKKVKNSFHPYNVNSLSSALAIASIESDEYFKTSIEKIVAARDTLTKSLIALGFTVLPSSANFVLAKSDKIGGCELYQKLKDRGILVRYFSDKRISDYVRITVGTDDEMLALVAEIKDILREI